MSTPTKTRRIAWQIQYNRTYPDHSMRGPIPIMLWWSKRWRDQHMTTSHR